MKFSLQSIAKGLGLSAILLVGSLLVFSRISQSNSTSVVEVPSESSGVAFNAVKTGNVTPSSTPSKEVSGNMNVVFFDAEVEGFTVDIAVEMLQEALKNTDGDVYLLINSPGGSVFDGTRLTDLVEKSGRINTVCITLCASMAAQLHQVGKKRLMVEKSVLMFHPAKGGLQGTIEEMKALLSMIDTYTARLDAKIAKRSNIPFEQFKYMVLKNLWVEAEDALKLKLADGLVRITVENLDSTRVSSRAMDKMIMELKRMKTLFGVDSQAVKDLSEKIQKFSEKKSQLKEALSTFK